MVAAVWEVGWEENTEGEKETNANAMDKQRAAAAYAPAEEDRDRVVDHRRGSSCFTLKSLSS